MSKYLLIYCKDLQLTACEAYEVDMAQGIALANRSGQLDSLPTEWLDLPAIVIIPSEDVLLTQVNIPAKVKGQQRMQAIAAMLEEELLQDVDQLHFAAGKIDSQGNIPVAVINKATLAQWLQRLQTYLPR
jgi:type II secretion system protein L